MIAVSNRELQDWLGKLGSCLVHRNIAAVAMLFQDSECFWRDVVAFTWSIETMDGRPAICAMLVDQLDAVMPVTFTPVGDATLNDGIVEGWFNFETAAARGRGHVRLRDGKCWTLLTSMTELKGHEEPAGFRRVKGVVHEAVKGARS